MKETPLRSSSFQLVEESMEVVVPAASSAEWATSWEADMSLSTEEQLPLVVEMLRVLEDPSKSHPMFELLLLFLEWTEELGE